MGSTEFRFSHSVENSSKALVFIHGYSGDRDTTWGKFPAYLAQNTPDWNIGSIGYPTSFLPDIAGIWSADPNLPILSTYLKTELEDGSLSHFSEIAIVAHSMGGLITQSMLVNNPDLCHKIKHVILFGTPSGGLRKAWWIRLWKRSLKNMARSSDYINNLRKAWNQSYETPPFNFVVVAGARDEFVPAKSSLQPFNEKFHKVVDGNHLTIVKPKSPEDTNVQIVAKTISDQSIENYQISLAVSAETQNSTPFTQDEIQPISPFDYVNLALEMERQGHRDNAIEHLEKTKDLHTDIRGALAGRYKRIWLENKEDYKAFSRAFELYQSALEEAKSKNDHGQIFYHAINLAFLSRIGKEDIEAAKQFAKTALFSCNQTNQQEYWNIATQAEAHIHIKELDKAVSLYKSAAKNVENKWQLASSGMHAAILASQLEDESFIEEVDGIFSPRESV